MTTKWERLEEWLFDTNLTGGKPFVNRDVAEGLGISTAEATQHIRSYERAQRTPDLRTLYVIHREGRTSRAIWQVGVRTADARAIGHTFFTDVNVKWRNAFALDLLAIEKRNKRAARKCEAIIAAVSESAMKLLQVAVDGLEDEDDDDNDGGGVVD